MSEEMAMSVPFPEMMSWGIYFFYFWELSDNNVKYIVNFRFHLFLRNFLKI